MQYHSYVNTSSYCVLESGFEYGPKAAATETLFLIENGFRFVVFDDAGRQIGKKLSKIEKTID